MSIDEIFSQLKDKLEVDESERLLLVSDVMRVPMILTTRDHIAQIQKTCEKVLGKEKMIEAMYQSGFDSGYDFATAIASMSDRYTSDYEASHRGHGKLADNSGLRRDNGTNLRQNIQSGTSRRRAPVIAQDHGCHRNPEARGGTPAG